MYQFRKAEPCPPSHEGQPLSGHTFAVRGFNNLLQDRSHQDLPPDEFELQCTKCSFKTTSAKPLRKDLSLEGIAENHEHDWQTTRTPLKTPYAFCFHCRATKLTDEKLDAAAYGQVCDHCGPSKFQFYGTWPTYPPQRVYRCETCDDIAARFTWHPRDLPNFNIPSQWLLDPHPFIQQLVSNPASQATLRQTFASQANLEGKLCDGCARFEGDAKTLRTATYVLSAHGADPQTSLRYVKQEVLLVGMKVTLYLDYCPACRKANNLSGFQIFCCDETTYRENDALAASLTKLKLQAPKANTQ